MYKELDKKYNLKFIVDNIERLTPQSKPLANPPTLFGAKGCQECMHTGYKGRTAVFEVLEISDEMRILIQKHASAQALREQAVSEGMITMFQDGFIKVLLGRTTLEEVLKATLE